MSQNNKPESNQQTKITLSKKLFTPLSKKEQEFLTGGWASRSSSGTSGSFW